MTNKRTLGRLLLALGVAIVISKDNKKKEKVVEKNVDLEKDIVVIVIEA